MNVQKWVNERAPIQVCISYILHAATPWRLRGVNFSAALSHSLAGWRRRKIAMLGALMHGIRCAEMADRDFLAAALCVRRAWIHFTLGVVDFLRLDFRRGFMETLSDRLKMAIADCGLSDKRLGELAGVNRLSLRRFANGETSLSLEQAEKLAMFFGLELKPALRGAGRKAEGKGK